MSSPAPARRPWLRWIQPLVVVGLLAWVASNLPWSDRLDWKDDAGGSVRGRIEGDWKGDAVRFAPRVEDRGAVERGAAPEVWVAALGEDGVHRVEGRPAALSPSMQRVFLSVERGPLALAMGCFLLGLSLAVTRWWRLLALAGCRVRWSGVFRLTFLGLFFNLVVPGLTGGDVVKAVLAVRENPERRADALVSVVVDRLLGLLALAALAMVVILLLGGPFAVLRWPMAVALTGLVLGGLVYVNGPLRRAVRFDALLERLPFSAKLRELDRAVLVYTAKPAELAAALALSLGNHFAVIAGVLSLGLAFGVSLAQVGVLDYVAIVPVASMVSALPVAPGGWGVGEAAYHYLFELVGASGALGVAVSVAYRLCQVLLGLAGGLYLLRPAHRRDLRAAERERADSAAASSPDGLSGAARGSS